MRQYRWLISLLAAVAILGVGAALALSFDVQHRTLRHEQEWVRALLQVGLIAVFGVATAGILERLKDTLQQRRDDSKLRFDVLEELSRMYMDVKLIRRKVQANNELTPTQIDRLNEIQVLVELHMRDSIRLFRKSSDLQAHLETMEHYLNELANKSNSEERRGFSSKGFKVFSVAYERSAALVRDEISGR
jgi:hypothetical protein